MPEVFFVVASGFKVLAAKRGVNGNWFWVDEAVSEILGKESFMVASTSRIFPARNYYRSEVKKLNPMYPKFERIYSR
jgi:hypothetical protein